MHRQWCCLSLRQRVFPVCAHQDRCGSCARGGVCRRRACLRSIRPPFGLDASAVCPCCPPASAADLLSPDRPWAALTGNGNRQGLLPSTQPAVVSNVAIEIDQPQQAFHQPGHQPGRLSQRQAKQHLYRQTGLDCSIAIMWAITWLAATFARGPGSPIRLAIKPGQGGVRGRMPDGRGGLPADAGRGGARGPGRRGPGAAWQCPARPRGRDKRHRRSYGGSHKQHGGADQQGAGRSLRHRNCANRRHSSRRCCRAGQLRRGGARKSATARLWNRCRRCRARAAASWSRLLRSSWN